jgi:hypothetical protein
MTDDRLPWEIDEEQPEAQPQLPATQASNPKRLLEVSFAEPTKEGKFPALPAIFKSVHMRSHMEMLALSYMTTPGLIGTEPLTDEDRKILTPAEILIYTDIQEALEAGCPQAKRQFWLERIMPPQLKRVESVQVTGDVKDWREELREVREEIKDQIREAERLEADRWKEDIVDV